MISTETKLFSILGYEKKLLARVHDNDELFGPVAPYSPTIRVADMNEKQKLEYKARVVKDKEATKKGYSRIKEKVKYFYF